MIYCNNVNVLINFFFIYLFVFIGFIAKKQFKDRVNEQSFVLVYIYFLMPIVMIWGILSKPLDVHLFLIPSYFLIILIMSFVFEQFHFHVSFSMIFTIFFLFTPESRPLRFRVPARAGSRYFLKCSFQWCETL